MSTLEMRATKVYKDNGGKFTFPWTSVLDIIKQLLGGCTTNRAAQRWARRNEAAAKDAIDSHFRENAVFRSSKDRAAAVEATYKTFVYATRAELRQVNIELE